MDVRERAPAFVAAEFAVFHYGGPTARGAQSPGTHSAPLGACAPRWRSRDVRPFKNQFRDPPGSEKALRRRISGNVCPLNKRRLDYLAIFWFHRSFFLWVKYIMGNEWAEVEPFLSALFNICLRSASTLIEKQTAKPRRGVALTSRNHPSSVFVLEFDPFHVREPPRFLRFPPFKPPPFALRTEASLRRRFPGEKLTGRPPYFHFSRGTTLSFVTVSSLSPGLS